MPLLRQTRPADALRATPIPMEVPPEVPAPQPAIAACQPPRSRLPTALPFRRLRVPGCGRLLWNLPANTSPATRPAAPQDRRRIEMSAGWAPDRTTPGRTNGWAHRRTAVLHSCVRFPSPLQGRRPLPHRAKRTSNPADRSGGLRAGAVRAVPGRLGPLARRGPIPVGFCSVLPGIIAEATDPAGERGISPLDDSSAGAAAVTLRTVRAGPPNGFAPGIHIGTAVETAAETAPPPLSILRTFSSTVLTTASYSSLSSKKSETYKNASRSSPISTNADCIPGKHARDAPFVDTSG